MRAFLSTAVMQLQNEVQNPASLPPTPAVYIVPQQPWQQQLALQQFQPQFVPQQPQFVPQVQRGLGPEQPQV